VPQKYLESKGKRKKHAERGKLTAESGADKAYTSFEGMDRSAEEKSSYIRSSTREQTPICRKKVAAARKEPTSPAKARTKTCLRIKKRRGGGKINSFAEGPSLLSFSPAKKKKQRPPAGDLFGGSLHVKGN